MRARSFAACLLGCLAFIGFLVSPGTVLGGDTKPQSVTIKGVITNLAEAKEKLAADTSLQLVLLGPDGGFKARTDDRGRFSADSNLPRLSVPAAGSKGTFAFECKGLDEGEYVVAVQLMERAGPNFLMKDGRPLKIRTAQVKPGSMLDVGEVTIPVRYR